MSFGMLIAVLFQTGSIIAFILILTPFRLPTKKALAILGTLLIILTILTVCLAARFGTIFLARYGYFIIGIPLFLTVYFLSRARGIRFAFVAMTAVVFQQMLLTLLMAFRIYQGGFTPLYFLFNLLGFGALLGGGYFLRKDYHKIVLSYRYEFICLTAILMLLFLFTVVFSPITDATIVDWDLFLITLFLDLSIVLLYLYIGVSFHSLGRRIDMEKDALSLRFRMEETERHLARLRVSQEQFFSWQQDRQRHIAILRNFIEQGETDKLQEYLDETEKNLGGGIPETYCQNEAVNLLLASYSARADEYGIRFLIDTHLPGNLSIDSTDLCALLGNALDNALQASQAVDETLENTVHLMARLSDSKLLIQVQNPYVGKVKMENGLPQILGEYRGFGVKSMETIVEKYSGLSSYDAKDGIFTVRFVI